MTIGEQLITIAENQEKVYNAGYEKGKAEGGGSGVDEYKKFWGVYQQSGNRTNYNYAFSGLGWSNDTFKPQYDIKPSNATSMFVSSSLSGDLAAHIEKLGITLDFSQCTTCASLFSTVNKVTRIPRINLSKATSASTLFSGCGALVTIDALVVSEKITSATNWFAGCRELTNITIEGVIAANIDMKQCVKLSEASIRSVIAALSTVNGGTLTFSKTAKEAAFTEEEWATLTATKPNWTIALA